ncbi:MAG: T9SS type A sorting domain-containing protein [Bacteroidetes bacterium]|nr:T9SS type A sorting domain-containing protein [Bacteroidota bacterium]
MIKLKMPIKLTHKLILLFLLISSIQVANGQVIGDYISIVSGNWTASSTWGVVTGTGPLTWSAAPGQPAAGNNVFVRSGHTVIIPVSGSYFCTNLTVESAGKLYTNNSVAGNNTYINVSGNITCNGTIGNSPLLDNISFNIESASCLISGTGVFDACRLRKNGSAVLTTNLTISMNLNLWFAAASTTQLYNNSANGIFNMTISAGATVSLLASGPTTGHCSIDGLNGILNTSGSVVDAGGTFTINGTLNISGILYFSNNNSNSATYKCNWVINGLVRASEISAGASTNILSGSSMTINAGGKLEITGTNAWSALSPLNNTFTFALLSTVEYSAAGNQVVRVASEFRTVATSNEYYGNLIMSTSGIKSLNVAAPILRVKNDLTISGTAVFNPNAATSNIYVGGSWFNYNQSGFTEAGSVVWFDNSAGVAGSQFINCPGGEVFITLRQFNPNNLLVLNCPVTTNAFGLGANFGHLDLNSFPLTINNTLTSGITGGGSSRYIISEKTDNSSKVIWKIGTGVSSPTGYIIPFGVPTPPSYIPVTIVKTNATSIGDISISTYGTPTDNLPWPSTPTNVTNLQAFIGANNTPDNRSWCVDRFWQVDATGTATLDSVKFSYRTSELPASDPVQANMKAQFWAGAFGYWNLNQYGVASVVTPGGNIVSVPNFNIFNTAWTLSSIASPLPIDLLYFGATKKEKSVELDWSTATEINNELFVLERSIDGKEFYQIGTVIGAGNSTQQLNYTFSDSEPVIGISYYRLKQIDFDGKYSYSKTVAINFNSSIQDVVIFPNPASKIVYITAKDLSNSNIVISDVAGRILKTEKISDSKLSVYPIEIHDLLPGIYQLQVVRNFEQETVRLVIN